MNITGKWTLPVVLICFLVVGIMLVFERTAHAKTKAECEKREALIKQADDYADSIERTLEAEKQLRADLEYDYEQLEAKYKSVRRGGKRAKDYKGLPDGDRADSLRNSIIRATRQ